MKYQNEIEKIKIDLEKKMTVDDTYNLVMKLYVANKEDFARLDTKIDNMENRIDNMENRMCSMENRMDNIESKIDNMENRMGNMERKIDNMEHKMGNMQEDIQIIKKLLLEKK